MRLLRCAALAGTVLWPDAAHAGGRAGEDFDVLRYDLAASPDIAHGTLAARETISLRITGDNVRRIVFSANALTIDSAVLDGRPVVTRRTGETIVFDPGAPLARGRQVRLVVTYHGRPARGFAGTPTSLYTSYFACDWMICAQDSFGDKADFALDLRVPAGMETLSLGTRVVRRPGPDGSEIHSWRAPRAYSAYLFGFAVGRFTRVEDGRLAYLGDGGSGGVVPANLRELFAPTAEMVRFLSVKAGLPLPVGTYSQLLVAGDEAQEAATYSVLGVEALPTVSGDPVQDWAIVHELAHQWWGNLVTCASLQDFWLNEGITTFMTAAWKEHRYGRGAYEVELALARGRLEKARALGFDKPLAWDGRYPSLGTRRAVQYSKGALFLDRLRSELGEKAFWAGLRRYTRRHAGGTVTSRDFERAMEAASGRNLQALFAEWVFGPSVGRVKI